MMTERALAALRRLEDGLLVTGVVTMVVLAVVQIVLRNVLDSGLPWIDPLLRALVMWVGMLGAIAASRNGRHITIDVLTRVLPGPARRPLRALACVLTSAVCCVLAWQGARYVLLEFGFADAAFLGIPTWAVAVILPLAFALIALRYLLLAVDFLRGRDAIPEAGT